jgi:hypothetical protein
MSERDLFVPSPGERVRVSEIGEYSAHHDDQRVIGIVGVVLRASVSPLGNKDWLQLEIETSGPFSFFAQCRVELVAKAVA